MRSDPHPASDIASPALGLTCVVPDDVAPVKKTRTASHERAPKNKHQNLIGGNDDAALFFALYRQRVKLQDSAITVSRAWFTPLMAGGKVRRNRA